MTYEPILKDFYKDLLTWINEGCPKYNTYNFQAHTGLCSAFRKWLLKTYPDAEFKADKFVDTFVKEGLDRWHPFNQSYKEYINKQNKYTNPARLNWIKEHAK